ncbi:MAG TPA: hypothetical protein VH593_27050 [Ktedonobacteraceae bacterium]|jgi:hypothetical protein
MTDDPVATLRALADIYRDFYCEPTPEMRAWAKHIDNVIERHWPHPGDGDLVPFDWCDACGETWPCPDITRLLPALAAWYRVAVCHMLDIDALNAIANHIDGVIERHRPDAYGWQTCTGCEAPGADYWPCPEVRELLAVAEALRVTND